MAYAELIEEAKDLSENHVSEVLDFIKFLKAQEKKNGSKVVFDALKDKLRYTADDFDATPECFKEYM